MNLILLFEPDFVAPDRVVLRGRRAEHVRSVHRAAVGKALTVGVAEGRMGRGVVVRMDGDAIEMEIALDGDPPPPLPVTLILALPRPKVLNRVIASATSLGVKRIFLINAWRVEKSYWSTPRLSPDNLREQSILGLEQARDTRMPVIETRRLFRPFVENELPAIANGTRRLVAHPSADVIPSVVEGPGRTGGAPPSPPGPSTTLGMTTLVIGPEGGFIEAEVASLQRVGFEAVSLGPRVLRVETAVAALLARLF